MTSKGSTSLSSTDFHSPQHEHILYGPRHFAWHSPNQNPRDLVGTF